MNYSNAVEVRSLVKSFGKNFTLGPLDLDVPRGVIFGLIGPNGAGKTTTLDLLLNIGQPQSGTIQIFGLQHRNDEVAIKQKVGYVSPGINYVAWKRVDRVLHYFRKFYPDWDDNYCLELLRKLNIGLKDPIQTMSFGAKIKLNLVVAMAHRPSLLILDEPTVGLDTVSRHEVYGELLKAVQSEDRTVLISSHALTDVERFADHIGFIKDGKMRMSGETASLLKRFQLCDFEMHGAIPTEFPDGVYPQSTKHDRLRVVLDSQMPVREWLSSNNLVKISTVPMSLEELFMSLVRD